MPDVQIFRGQVSDVPGVYTLPDAVSFILKAVNASFDGSGAAGAYLPCVTILSDSGHVIARAVDQAVSVAAGGDAEVSFFPHVKNAAAASGAGSSLPWAIVSIAVDDPGLAIGTAFVAVPYDLTNGSDTFYMTNDATVFSFDSVNHAHQALVSGFYMIQTWSRLRQVGTANAGNFTKIVISGSLELPSADSMTSYLGGNASVPGYIIGQTFWDPNSTEYADYRGTSPKWQHVRSNRTGATLTGQRSTFLIVRLGDSKDTGTIP